MRPAIEAPGAELERRAVEALSLDQCAATLRRLGLFSEASAILAAAHGIRAGAPIGVHRTLEGLRASAALAVLLARPPDRLRLLR